jgi:hypothetical protein
MLAKLKMSFSSAAIPGNADVTMLRVRDEQMKGEMERIRSQEGNKMLV